MSILIKTLAVTATALAFSAPAAFAGESPQAPEAQVDRDVKTAPQQDTAQALILRNEVETEVRGAIESGDYIVVEGPDGRVYYNHVIAIEDLPDPELDLRQIDTYTFEYEGKTFTNKIVQEVG